MATIVEDTGADIPAVAWNEHEYPYLHYIPRNAVISVTNEMSDGENSDGEESGEDSNKEDSDDENSDDGADMCEVRQILCFCGIFEAKTPLVLIMFSNSGFRGKYKLHRNYIKVI